MSKFGRILKKVEQASPDRVAPKKYFLEHNYFQNIHWGERNTVDTIELFLSRSQRRTVIKIMAPLQKYNSTRKAGRRKGTSGYSQADFKKKFDPTFLAALPKDIPYLLRWQNYDNSIFLVTNQKCHNFFGICCTFLRFFAYFFQFWLIAKCYVWHFLQPHVQWI